MRNLSTDITPPLRLQHEETDPAVNGAPRIDWYTVVAGGDETDRTCGRYGYIAETGALLDSDGVRLTDGSRATRVQRGINVARAIGVTRADL
jgi:hypothetical protein